MFKLVSLIVSNIPINIQQMFSEWIYSASSESLANCPFFYGHHLSLEPVTHDVVLASFPVYVIDLPSKLVSSLRGETLMRTHTGFGIR